MNAPVATTTNKTPREIGRDMLRLREQFNLTPQEVAERIHIRPRYIIAMEEGRYDQMPGKVYARGYIQTYAEFLGMHVETTIAQCFAGEPMPSDQPLPPPAKTIATLKSEALPYGRLLAVLVVLAFGAVGLLSLITGADPSSPEPTPPNVAPVPEAILASMRTLVMPTANNYECLTMESPLGCFYTDATSRLLSRLMQGTNLLFVGEVDVSEWVLTPEIAPEPQEKSTDSKPVPPPRESPAVDAVQPEPTLEPVSRHDAPATQAPVPPEQAAPAAEPTSEPTADE